MKKTLSLLGFVGAALLVACGSDGVVGPAGEKGTDGTKGDNGTPGTPGTTPKVEPSLDFATPNKGILDRTIEVTLSASGTKFAGSPKVDFGAGITVSEVKALSATAISAKLVIAPTAALGVRDVTIDGQKLEKAFAVVPAISSKLVGTAQQGGVANVAIQNNDTANPFDKDNLSLVAPDLVNLSVAAESNVFAGGAFVVPPLASGSPAFSLANVDAEGKPRTTFLGDPNDVKVTARAPVALTANAAPATLNLGAQLVSYYAKGNVPAATTMIVDYRVQVAANAKTSPFGLLFGKGGTAKDVLGVMQPPQGFFGPNPPPYDLHLVVPFASQAAAEDEYLVLFDSSGTGGAATFGATFVKAELVAEGATAHATGPTAQDLAVLQGVPANLATDIGGKVVTGNLATTTEVDVYKVTVAANDRLQIGISGEGEYDVIVTPDGSADPEGAANLGYLYSASKGQLGSDEVAVGALTTVYIAVTPYQARNGKYSISVRKVPNN
jgi:hypothetical protein